MYLVCISSSPPRHSNTLQSPSGYATMLSLFHESHAPLATSSPVGKVAATNADLGCAVDETWQSEVLLQVCNVCCIILLQNRVLQALSE